MAQGLENNYLRIPSVVNFMINIAACVVMVFTWNAAHDKVFFYAFGVWGYTVAVAAQEVIRRQFRT